MKTYINRIIGILILFIMISCALESQFALPNDEKIKSELIGEWYSEKNGDERIKIIKNGEKLYTLHIIDKNETDELIAFSKTIKGISIMNVKAENKGIMNKQVATIGGGCFWCLEALMQRLRGVTKVLSGYAGGHSEDPKYRAVCSGKTRPRND